METWLNEEVIRSVVQACKWIEEAVERETMEANGCPWMDMDKEEDDGKST